MLPLPNNVIDRTLVGRLHQTGERTDILGHGLAALCYHDGSPSSGAVASPAPLPLGQHLFPPPCRGGEDRQDHVDEEQHDDQGNERPDAPGLQLHGDAEDDGPEG
jgi:hypothetical protein